MATLNSWEQRQLDATGRLPEHRLNPPGDGRGVGSSRSPARASTRQGQASLTSESPRFIVFPGVRGYSSYTVWDSLHSTINTTTASLQDAINIASSLNTQPVDPS